MFLLDTNMVVYAVDPTDKRKHDIAKLLLAQAAQASKGAISSQVAQEFCNVMLKKFTTTIRAVDLSPLLDEILLPLWQHVPSPDFYKRSIRLCQEKQLSLYDALIVQAALDLGCTELYSEDLQTGQKFGKLTVVDPFK